MHTMPGVVIAVVKGLDDPEGEGRIQVEFPWLQEGEKSAWAPIAASFAGGNRGAFFHPEIDDECLVAFEHGRFDHPFICGFLWNGADRPPTTDSRMRVIRSLNGHEIAIYDPDVMQGDQGFVRIKSGAGDEIVISNTGISITSRAQIVLQAPNIVINGRPVAPMPKPI